MDFLYDYKFPVNPRFQGAQANVYVHDEYAIKVFKEDKKPEAFYEAMILSLIEHSGFITPKIYQVSKTTNWTLIMDYFSGDLVSDALADGGQSLLDEIIQLQVSVNTTECFLPVRTEDRIKSKILDNNVLDSNAKSKLIRITDSLNNDCYLCHGDFHPQNIIKTENGFAIIDWIDATIGDSLADGCRSYLLYLLYYKDAADYYLKSYCKYRNIKVDDFLRVLPAVAGARLSEKNEREYSAILDIIDKYS